MKPSPGRGCKSDKLGLDFQKFEYTVREILFAGKYANAVFSGHQKPLPKVSLLTLNGKLASASLDPDAYFQRPSPGRGCDKVRQCHLCL